MESAVLLEKARLIKKSVDNLLQEKSRLSGRREELSKSLLSKFGVTDLEGAKQLRDTKTKERDELSAQLEILTGEMEKLVSVKKES